MVWGEVEGAQGEKAEPLATSEGWALGGEQGANIGCTQLCRRDYGVMGMSHCVLTRKTQLNACFSG